MFRYILFRGFVESLIDINKLTLETIHLVGNQAGWKQNAVWILLKAKEEKDTQLYFIVWSKGIFNKSRKNYERKRVGLEYNITLFATVYNIIH